MAEGMKRLAKETAIYGLPSILGKFLNWLLVPMYVRVLDGTGEFGIYTNLYAWVALFLVILTYGMETGFFRFINKQEEKEEPLRVYATALFSIAFTSILFFILGILFLEPAGRALGYDRHPEYLGMMMGTVALDAFTSIPYAYLRYAGQSVRFATIRFINIFLNIGLNLFFYLACPWLSVHAPATVDWFYNPAFGVGYAFVANVVTSVAVFLMLLPAMLPGIQSKPDAGLLRRMLRYSFPVMILGVAGIFNQTADKIIFPFLFEDRQYADAQLGIYGACFRMAAVMVMFIQAFRYAYEPFIFSRNREEGSYVESMRYFIIFALLIFLGVMFYIDILKYFVTPDYYPGLRILPVVMMGELFFGIYFNLSFWYKLTDRTHWGAWFSLIGCVATVLIIVLFAPGYGYMACAWASFCCNLLMMILSYLVGQKKKPVPYDLRSALIYFSVAGVLFTAAMLPNIDSLAWRLIYRTVLLAFFIVFIVKRDLPAVGRYFRKT
ncbi:MAG: oligosaccharide flippase family protein [Tannerellaceae bacterium]|jgi:O-antigen/teichoic acid export membrane protein|nr:oligosaccharide flippase family protein [Tannerellaceae bacterium]